MIQITQRRSCQILRTRSKIRAATSEAYLQRVNLAIDHIVTHLSEPLPLKSIARAASLSPFHFHRIFQAIIGVTLADFVKRLRLERAVVMMVHGPRRASLTSIALACGFSSSSDFSRCFKQRFGVAPSSFDAANWSRTHAKEFDQMAALAADRFHLQSLPDGSNPDRFSVTLRELPARTVAYIRVIDPYKPSAVTDAATRLVAWAEQNNLAHHPWLGYQWDNPRITSLEQCHYHVAVEADRFTARGEVGRFRFPPMRVAQLEIRGPIDLEIRALTWLYGTWLPASGHVPDDQPCFEAWHGRPFAHGVEHFELTLQLPVRRG